MSTRKEDTDMNRGITCFVLLAVIAGTAFNCSQSPAAAVECEPVVVKNTTPALTSTDSTPVYVAQIVKTYPHDPNAFTQGLVYCKNGRFAESTGLNGESSLRIVELETGKVLKRHNLDKKYFAEGLALWGNQLIQLTWKEHVAFVYDKDSFELLKTFNYPTEVAEGWGLTHDGKELVLSDGSATLYFLNPETFKVTRKLEVRDQGLPVTYLNELEYINGEIYANVWQTNQIVRIDPNTGKVLAWIDLTGLLKPEERVPGQTDVLNGIAYDPEQDRLFVTGKRWPKVFEIKLLKK
jgi:glutamine cyclotransferase